MGNLREFKFYMSEPETGGEYSFQEKIPDYDPDYEDQITYIFDEFKHFLRAVGFAELTISKIQYLENDEWKYVLERYGEWDTEKQKHYEYWKKTEPLEAT